MPKFSERLKQLRNEHKISQQDLADRIGMSKSSINMYERGEREPGLETLEALADYFNVDLDYLLGKSQNQKRDLFFDIFKSLNKQSSSNISEVITDNIYKIPVYESVSAGFGAHAEDYVIDFIPTIITNPYDVENTIGIRVIGNSMFPKIEDGDTIVVRKQESVDSGQVAVMLIDGDEGVVKQVFYDDNSVTLHSFNPEYMDRCFKGSELERLRVVGLVKQVIKQI